MSETLEATLKPLIEGFSGRVSVALQGLARPFSYTYQTTLEMHAASLIKLPILFSALLEVHRGGVDLAQRVPLRAADRVGGSGVLHAFGPGIAPSVQDLLTLMIIVSDNTATNMVIDLVGLETVNVFCRQQGLHQTELVGKLQLPDAQLNEAQRAGKRNRSCAADMLGLMAAFARQELLPPPLHALSLEILKKQQFTEALGRYLPTDAELAPQTDSHSHTVQLACKSGCLRGLWHDAGIVYRADGSPLYTLVVMTDSSSDRSFGWEQEGMMLIARVSQRVFEWLSEVQ